MAYSSLTLFLHPEHCYGYSIYVPHITYPFHYYKNFWYRKSLSLYLLLNISFTNRVLPFKNPKTPFLFTLLYLLHFCYIRVKGQCFQTCRVECSNLYSNTFLKWQVCLRHFRHLKTESIYLFNDMNQNIQIQGNSQFESDGRWVKRWFICRGRALYLYTII